MQTKHGPALLRGLLARFIGEVADAVNEKETRAIWDNVYNTTA